MHRASAGIGPTTLLLLIVVASTRWGCQPPAPTESSSEVPVERSSGEDALPPGPAAAGGAAGTDPATGHAALRVAYLGDSLAAGYGLPAEEAFPAVVEVLLRERGLELESINAGVSGDTSAGGRNRIGWLLRQKPDLVVVELGANDGLRGLSPEATEENLRAIIVASLEAGAAVLLTGMKVPPNYGGDYTRRFEETFERLAEEQPVGFLPFLLEGVAGDPALNLADGIHPNAEGHRRVAASLAPRVEAALKGGRSRRP